MLRRNILTIVLIILISLGLSVSGCSLRKGSSRVYFDKSGLKKRIAVLPFQEYPNYKGEPLGRRVAAALADNLLITFSPGCTGVDDFGTAYLAQGLDGPVTIGTAATNADGDYLFSNLPVDSYIVRQELPDQYTQVFPGGDGTYTITTIADTHLAELDFGVRITPLPEVKKIIKTIS